MRSRCFIIDGEVVSKRLGSRYVSGRRRDWLKIKNPNAPAVKREGLGSMNPPIYLPKKTLRSC